MTEGRERGEGVVRSSDEDEGGKIVMRGVKIAKRGEMRESHCMIETRLGLEWQPHCMIVMRQDKMK